MTIENIVKMAIAAGVAHSTNKVSQWLGKTFETVAFLNSYRSCVTSGLVGCGVTSWLFDEKKAGESFKNYYNSTRKTIQSGLKITGFFAVGTGVSYALASLKIIPIKPYEVTTLAKLGMIATISYKIYMFFSIPEETEKQPLTENKIIPVVNAAPKITYSEDIEEQVNIGLEKINNQIEVNNIKIYSIVPKNVSSLLVQQTKEYPIHLKINNLTLQGRLFINGVQEVVVFPFRINHQPCLLSITKQKGEVLTMAFWKGNIENKQKPLQEIKKQYKALEYPEIKKQTEEKPSNMTENRINLGLSHLAKAAIQDSANEFAKRMEEIKGCRQQGSITHPVLT